MNYPLILERRRKLLLALLIGALVFLALRDCVPGLNGSALPADVEDSITSTYQVCISPDDTPIEPNAPRQPECGQVKIEVVGDGVVPAAGQASGVTRAICYKVTIENPYWTTLGTTRHEVKWKARTASKVAVRQTDTWRTFPDQDDLDRQRWAEYACPAPYGG